MGALEIRNKKLRCPQCLDIRRLLIVPGYPDPKIEIMCHCNKSVESFLDYCSELKKTQNFKLICAKCGKEEIKHPRFCYECLSVYCSKCCNSHTPRITGNEESNKNGSIAGHKTIHVEKLDFYCINHQEENYMAYCQQCLMNICNQCLKEGTHKFHSVELYSVLQLDKKSKEQVKKGIKKIEKKIEKNNNLIKKFIKKNKKCEGIKEIEEEFKVVSEENDNIFELVSKCYELYDHSKIKNYSIIYNLIKNSKFNLKLLKFEKKETTEEKIDHISKYLKKDFYILYKRSKTNVEEFEVDNNEENQEEEEDDDEEYTVPTTFRSSSFHKSSARISNAVLDNNINEEQTNNINVIHENDDENDIKRIETAPQTILNPQQEVNSQNIIKQNNNNISQPPKKEIKKLKMPAIFNPQVQKRPSAAVIPPPKKLVMPSMFEKKAEDNKPKERAAIIQTGASGGLGNKKDFLSQMLNKQGMAGKPKGAGPAPTEIAQPVEEKIEIIHEANEGNTEDVLNKVTVNTKKKKPRRAKFVIEGEENQEPINQEQPKPETETKPENEPKPETESTTSQVTDNNNNIQDTTTQVPQEQTVVSEIKEENQGQQVQEEHQEQQGENEINS